MDPITILLVEDDPLVRVMVEDALGEASFAVDVAETADEAMGLLEGDAARFRTLVTDVELGPGNQTGWDVARRARELAPELPVVYMTGGRANDWTAQGVPKSILLVKPFVPAQLITAVASLMNEAAAGPAEDGT